MEVSSRRLLNERKRPFYRSAISYPLSPLPIAEVISFIVGQFKRGGKSCPEYIAGRIAERVRGYPYYIQRLSYSIFEVSGKKVTQEDYTKGFKRTIDEEKLVCEAMLQGLAPQQIKLLTSLAEEPTDKPYSSVYMAKHNLGSVGGIQGALKKLLDLDYIEKKDNTLQVVDPVFAIWLRHLI